MGGGSWGGGGGGGYSGGDYSSSSSGGGWSSSRQQLVVERRWKSRRRRAHAVHRSHRRCERAQAADVDEPRRLGKSAVRLLGGQLGAGRHRRRLGAPHRRRRPRAQVRADRARPDRGYADTATPAGPHGDAARGRASPAPLRDAWVYGGAVNEPMRDARRRRRRCSIATSTTRARGSARRRSATSRARRPRRAASEYTPRSDEGAGVILVSVIVAARRELFTVNRIGSGDDLRQALDAASQLRPTTWSRSRSCGSRRRTPTACRRWRSRRSIRART